MLKTAREVMRSFFRRTPNAAVPPPEKPISYHWTASDIIRFFDKDGIAFVHVPKTGGTAMGQALYGVDIGHIPIRLIHAVSPRRKFRSWFKFAVVREPIDRFLSAYDFLAGGGINETDAAFGRKWVAPEPGVNQFIDRLATDSEFRQAVMAYWHFRPQTEFVTLPDGSLPMDSLMSFEAIGGPITLNGLALGKLPILNATPGSRTSREQLTASSIRRLEELYAQDFRLATRAVPAHRL